MKTTGEIARLIAAEIEGDSAREIRRVAKIEEAGEGDITFIANPKYGKYLGLTRASAVIIGRTTRTDGPHPVLLRVPDPYASFLKVLVAFHPPHDPVPPGTHPSAVIDASARLGTGVRVGALAVIGAECCVGEGTMIGEGTILGRGVEVGAGAVLHAQVTVREGCRIGARVIVHSGTVIGSDGFGFAPMPDGTYEKIPQVGIVVIEDDVEVGANCAIDRATLGETRIGKGAKLDNLIQVAHNVVIGENTVIAAQAGISGSTRIGRNAMLGGQVGITGHLEIADGTRIGAQSGVHHSVSEPGTTLLGYPALPQRQALRVMGAVPQLPELLARVRELEREIARLKQAQ